ncbi:MAG TPA: tRNA (adenosine(37)-N6)-threonylcarbamoyltransferase complex dimerization subunit type 1 TsaB [Streptosporangiaceae bacterium]|nr:tRNA (adenosine(37)-N6)-threonylcarbamoyltransferase complex dimerization subunit type 1 TsaB [Streptosporangiaceae bacterium]
MLILAFDTATPAVTVALHDGSRVLARESVVDSRRHGESLAPAITKALAAARATIAEVTTVAVGVGPGPYTGLRAGLVTARVFGSTLDIEVDGVCTLDIIAAQASAGQGGGRGVQRAGPPGTPRSAGAGREFLVATDARRREVYWARYAADGTRLEGPQVCLPAELPEGYPIAGEGPLLYSGLAKGCASQGGRPPINPRSEIIDPRYPDAAVLARLSAERIAAGLPPGDAEPLYLRRPDAREPGKPKRVTPAGVGGARA